MSVVSVGRRTVAGMDLTEFLLARIAEDEAVARAAEAAGPYPYSAYLTSGEEEGSPAGVHLHRHHPARVLAECTAKRRIVERHTGDHWCPEARDPEGLSEIVNEFDGYDELEDGTEVPRWFTYTKHSLLECGDLRSLALPYVDHPDYLEEWRP